MRAFFLIAAVLGVLAAVPLVVHSNVTLNFLVAALTIALVITNRRTKADAGGRRVLNQTSQTAATRAAARFSAAPALANPIG